MMEMITGLAKMGKIKPRIISLKEGPLREAYERLGISVRVLSFEALKCSVRYYDSHLGRWKERVRMRDCDMVYANTMNCFFAIDAAHKENIPSVWNIRESSYAKESFGRVSNAVAHRAFKTFQYPYRIIFVAGSTRELFEKYNNSNNFALIKNVLAPREKTNLSASIHDFPKESKLLLNVGTVCKRKAQGEIITAFETLSEGALKDSALVFLGEKSSSYAKRLESKVQANSRIKEKVSFLGSVEDIGPWYEKACAFVFSSKNESYPRVILEAMGAGLPIITTSVFGIKEQIIENLNAIVYQSGDFSALKEAMEKIITNNDLRNRLSSESKNILKSLGTNKEMLQKYEDIFFEAASSS
jgi:glycosyltransferase involved in cell wall biosynthesis